MSSLVHVPSRLPATYEQAKKALAACNDIDECKDWADKAAALAVYAYQAADTELKDRAVRIQLRAEERIGELLLQIPRGTAVYDPKKKKMISNADGRWATAKRAGVTNGQYYRATSIARVPKSNRNRLIESSPPIRPHALARIGVGSMGPSANLGKTDSAYLRAGGEVGRLIRWTYLHSARTTGVETNIADAGYLRKHLPKLLEWLDELEHCLPREEP